MKGRNRGAECKSPGASVSRRDFIGLMASAGAALALPSFVSAADGPPGGERPNVIFIIVDDMGYADLGCYGHPHIKSPNLDRLARQGTLFTQFYVNSAVCSSRRAGLGPSTLAFATLDIPAAATAAAAPTAEVFRKALREMPSTPFLPVCSGLSVFALFLMTFASILRWLLNY